MSIDRILNSGLAPALDQVLRFTEARHRLIAQNIANVDTPNYRQQDLSVPAFQQAIARRLQARKEGNRDVRFDDLEIDLEHPSAGILAHDGNNLGLPNITSATSPAKAVSGTSSTGGTSFADMLKQNIDEVTRLQQDASSAIENLATGKTQDVTGVMSAMEKSDLAFKTLLSIRAKLLQAYDEIKNIPV